MHTTLALILLLCAVAPAAPQTDLGRRVDEYLTRLERLGFSGNALVARDGKVLLEKGYGLADRGRKIPVTPETVISVGSITKQFTGAAILKLEMQGKLRVEDPISKYLPGVPSDKSGVTIHHLLTHTAGLRSDYGPSDHEPVLRDEYLRRVLSAPLEAPPGARHVYSNAGYSLAAAIVEIVSGRSYERFLHDELFEPAGMRSTGYKIPKWAPERIARGYVDGRDWGTILEKPMAEDGPYWNLRGNGGIHSTPGDMYRWHVALEGEAVLSKAAKEKFFTPYVAEGPEGDSHYGYGWAIFTTPRKTRLVAHNGGNMVFAADFRRYVDEGVVIYIASNAEVSAIPVSDVLPRVVFGMEYAMPPAVVEQPAEALDRLAGSYATASGERLVVRREGGRLSVAPTGREAFGLLFAPLPPERAAQLERRVAAILEGAAKGDYRATAEAFGGNMSREEVDKVESGRWGEWRGRFGEYRGSEVLGTARMPPMAATIARLDFERGTVFLRYGWDGPDLAGVRVLEAPPALALHPTGAADFSSFNVREATPATARFEGETLTVRRGATALTARRLTQ